MKVYGLIGNPLEHSFSQKYFTEKFEVEHIADCIYQNFELKNLDKEVPVLKSNGHIQGLNVTIPYKSQIIPFLHDASDVCKEINACNCIKIINGKWVGHNTDVIGFEKTFASNLQPQHSKALILGTGGSSKAVAYILQKLQIDFLFVSREKSKTDEIIQYDLLTPTLLKEYKVVINTTPLGMYPHVTLYPEIPYESISPEHYFFDLVYNPSETVFLTKAKARGAFIANGERMLAIQAEESWKIWTQ